MQPDTDILDTTISHPEGNPKVIQNISNFTPTTPNINLNILKDEAKLNADTEAILAWRKTRDERIAESAVKAAEISQIRRQEATRELESLRLKHQDTLSQRKAHNRTQTPQTTVKGDLLNEFDKPGPWDDEPSLELNYHGNGDLTRKDVPWADVLTLIEGLPKPTLRTSDGGLAADRLLAIIKRQAANSQQ